MNPYDQKIAEQAMEWVDALKRGGAEERAAFTAWLKISPRHVGEYLMISALQSRFNGSNATYPESVHDVDALLTHADSNVVELQERDSALAPTKTSLRTVKMRYGLGAAAAVLLAITAAWFFNSMPGQNYTTRVGELHSFDLPDGSVIQLNTHSKVTVNFSKEHRDVRLVNGEALFRVAKDPARPFRVRVDHATIQAVGTQFNVYRRNDDTKIAVIEGSVRVSGNGRSGEQVVTHLKAGEAISVQGAGRLTEASTVDTTQVRAWQQRRLVFKAKRLDEIAAEFNLYNLKPKVRTGDARVAERRLTGVFDADDPRSLVQFLTNDDSLTVDERADEIVIRQRGQ